MRLSRDMAGPYPISPGHKQIYIVEVKSVSPSLAQASLATPQVHLFFSLKPQAQAVSFGGTAFSTGAFSQLQCKAACLPQEQVDFWAQTHWAAEQDIIGVFVWWNW